MAGGLKVPAIPDSLGRPKPVDADWRDVQAQIDAVVHELDPPEDHGVGRDETGPPAQAGSGKSQ
jgi:hypothetical protein